MGLRQDNPRRQGDIGEASAIQWLTKIGAGVCFPMFHSPDFDLVAEIGGRLYRVQVKTSTCLVRASVYAVQTATNGGNQSWTGQVKRFDPARCDFLFVLVADGRRWFIPTSEIASSTGVTVGASRYSEYEVGQDRADSLPSRIADIDRGSAGAGEPGRTVNSVAQPEWVRIPPPPSDSSDRPPAPLATARTVVSSNRQVTLARPVFESAELEVGDRFRVDAIAPGRIGLVRVEEAAQDHAARLWTD